MANNAQLSILRDGVSTWNAWRSRHPNVSIDLSMADLFSLDLQQINLRGADLHRASLSCANLSNADLTSAILTGAFCNDTTFYRVHLEGAILSGADLSASDLRETHLQHAILRNADLRHANLTDANLSYTNLVGANLYGVNIHETTLSHAKLGWTIVGHVDLHGSIGLETIEHVGPSEISVYTIYQSDIQQTNQFLRKAGIPQFLLQNTDQVPHPSSPVDTAKCFICYCALDQVFAQKLYEDLQQQGLCCWLAPVDTNDDDSFWYITHDFKNLFDTLIIVLSKHSKYHDKIVSLIKIAKRKKNMRTYPLVFLDIDNTAIELPSILEENEIKTNIFDFSQWSQKEKYQASLTYFVAYFKQ